ncbi:Centrosomal protein of 41 kDa [Phytophthora pseudosyringae]|uniref:Centrosomal protein of 41 kDa n=1 Tax=Phytophthora pseudosyringae TaxID=221518 RepID=A0A8T1VPM4_9STRA|nr:Centrosomal protein of 41 kDa [Phytophthora pseudosyringae]
MSRLTPKAPTEEVKLSNGVFAVWWVVLLGVHVLTCVYTALYAYSYWALQDQVLNVYLESYEIGMPSPYHRTIAVVHSVLSGLHAVCIALMVGGSIRQGSLAFTPWVSCNADAKHEQDRPDRANSLVLQSFGKMYGEILDRHGLCGVNSEHFHAVLVVREVVETALQTVQAYRMSELLPRTLLNRFYVVLLAVNCWSSVLVYPCLFKRDEARRRLACIVLDCALDLVACIGIELIVLMSYAPDYDPSSFGFPATIWYDDEWVARALNEFKMVVVVSWSDLASRVIFSLGLVVTTTSMKELLYRLPPSGNRVTDFVDTKVKVQAKRTSSETSCDAKHHSASLKPPTRCIPESHSNRRSSVRDRRAQLALRGVHGLFGLWGLLGWTATHSGISGQKDEVSAKWSEFDASTIVQLLIRHCPQLEMPDMIRDFHGLRNIKMYNTTINEWGEAAAITSTNHPGLSTLLIARVNMTDGLLPVGLQSRDFPQTLFDIELCVTNLRALPDDLDSIWPLYAFIQVEYGQLTSVPPVLLRLEPQSLALTGNPLTDLPPEVFEVQGMLHLGISHLNLHQLPSNVTHLSAELSWVFIGDTNISFFWAWADELVERMKGRANPWIAEPSPYCEDLAKLESGAATAFRVPLLPEYSQTLMDPSETNREMIRNAVRCDPTIEGLFYPLANEDRVNAISTPLPRAQPPYYLYYTVYY